ncbi:3-hydroxyisobutyrate dehydrogenase [Friedmanniella luteola]|uniref:3-hydroxyisobutyrate dehydrogenase n=1 Tax=Friedmanniella luteola TaxID=546871 RepID=A0A1H1P934_9ACTN|nr:NAD(P)-dependent oxidoreductase [Friedmanniella luteola]SDS07663.1 3-hydroxyisobutyrate dehydrogenase [Friedmanniella luteola]
MTDVAVLGTGTMGAPMAASLLAAGHAVRVWNRSPGRTDALVAAGATAARSPAEAVAGADVVLTMLFDLEATRAVMAEAVGAVGLGAVWLQTGTVGPVGTAELAALAAEHGLAFLDAPVLGTRKPAEDGTLVVLASGDPALRARVAPVLDAVAARVVWAGDRAGAASALKLAANTWVLTLTAATAQSLVLAQAQGVDPELFLEAIRGTATDSAYAQTKGPAMLQGAFSPAFGLDGGLKDLGLILAAAEARGLPSRLLGAVRDCYATASAAGHGEDDIAAVVTALRGED